MILKDFNIEVMPYLEAQKHFNEMINVGLPNTSDAIENLDIKKSVIHSKDVIL